MSALAPPHAELGQPGDVDDGIGAVPVEVQLEHDVGAAGDRQRLGMLRFDLQGLFQRPRQEDLHQNFPHPKASIMAGTSSPSGYSTGHVQPASTYSRTLARHSSGVPPAVISWTTSSGTSRMAFRISSSEAGHVSTLPISSRSEWSTPLAFMMFGCWPRHWVTSSAARSSAT